MQNEMVNLMHLLWDTFWAQSLQCNDIGLVQRFLFSFGVYGDPVPSKCFSFYEGFTVPLVRRLFEAMLLASGPACAPRVFTTTPAQNTVIQELERTETNFKRKVSVAGGLQGALPKAMYWIPNGAMTNHILQHLLPPVLAEPPLSGKPLGVPRLPDEISDAAFVTAKTFAVRRYLFGQEVLAKSAEEQSWLGKDVPIARPMAGDEELIVRLLRGATGASVREADVVVADLDIERALRKGGPAEQNAARKRLGKIRSLMSFLEVGAMTDTKEGKVFAKFDPHWLSNRARDWLREQRIPLQLWGLRLVPPPAEEKDNATETDPDGAEASLCPATARDSPGQGQRRRAPAKRPVKEIVTSKVLAQPLLQTCDCAARCLQWMQGQGCRYVWQKSRYRTQKWSA